MADQLTIEFADPFGEAASRLIGRLSAELSAIYPEDESAGGGSFSPGDSTGPNGRFLIACQSGQPVGCAALRRVGEDVAEFKRLYVVPDFRGRGISRELLTALERTAHDMGFRRVLAETGLRQPQSLRLLKSSGYARIENYCIYVGNPLSACFGKLL